MKWWWNGGEWILLGPPPGASRPGRRALFVIVAAATIAALLILALAAGLIIRAALNPTVRAALPGRCLNSNRLPATLPLALFLSNNSGPLIDPLQATRVVTAFWPIEEKALATDDQATTDLIESGPAAEYADAISCEDQILGVQSIRTVRPASAIYVYVSRQNAYPVSFLAEVDTTVYARGPYNDPGAQLPPGTKFVEYMVFVKVDAQSRWKVAIDTGYAGAWITDPPTLESPLPASGQIYNAPPPRPDWIDPRAVPQALASYWQHWVSADSPLPNVQFAAGRWTTIQGANLEQGHQRELALGVVPHTQYFVDLDKDGAYQFAVAKGVDLECFAVRYTDPLTSPTPGGRLFQDTRRADYGALLPPGSYSTIVVSGLHQSCALIPPSPDQPLFSGSGPGIGIVGGQGGDTRLTGSA
jgi:hypothetical protein